MPAPNTPQNPDPQRPKRTGPGGNGPSGRGPRGPQNFMSRGFFGWVMLIALMIVLLLVMNGYHDQYHDVDQSQFLDWAKHHSFDGAVTVENEAIRGTLKDGTELVDREWGKKPHVVAKISLQTKEKVWTELQAAGVAIKENPGDSIWGPLIMSWGPFLVIILLVYFFVFRSIRNAGGGPGMLGSFGRSRHKVMNKEHSNVTLADVAGVDEAKDEVGEIIEFLKNPKRFQRLGGRVPRGVLLVGEPGCGKTLLAKAVAGEADVPFFSISGSDFVEMFVGVGASRVRDLFKQAKDSAPCIIFLDEIDAVGRRRTYDPHGGSQETSQTLNAILVEMDGFDTNDQVIVMAATNRADVLDPALTRPGRFDRQIHVPLPDLRGRVEILKVHSRRVKMSPNLDLERLARATPMFSGADLAAIINEAAIAATLQNKDFVEQTDLEEARDKVKWGRARKSHKIEEDERVATAYHEAGHAVLQILIPHADPLHKVTIIPRGQSLGSTMSLPEKDRYGYARRYLLAVLRVLCGGRIAEQRKTADVSSGAAMDIQQATTMARRMILDWGMSDRLGFINFSGADHRDSFLPEREYSDQTARIIDEEVKRLIDEAYAEATRMLDENWAKVEALAEALLRLETLTSDEVERLMKGEKLTKATVGDLLRAEQDKNKPAPKPNAPTATDPGASGPGGVLPQPA
jgi:cell division protease FtsH